MNMNELITYLFIYAFIYSFFSKHFILVRVVVDRKTILGTLDTMQGFIVNRKPVHYTAPHIHTFMNRTHRGDFA